MQRSDSGGALQFGGGNKMRPRAEECELLGFPMLARPNTIRPRKRTFMGDTTPGSGAALPANVYSRKNPFLAELTRHELLTKPGSEKETRHFVVSLAGSDITYTPGDSLGAFGRNPPKLVDDVIALLGFEPGAQLSDPKGQSTTLREAL